MMSYLVRGNGVGYNGSVVTSWTLPASRGYFAMFSGRSGSIPVFVGVSLMCNETSMIEVVDDGRYQAGG